MWEVVRGGNYQISLVFGGKWSLMWCFIRPVSSVRCLLECLLQIYSLTASFFFLILSPITLRYRHIATILWREHHHHGTFLNMQILPTWILPISHIVRGERDSNGRGSETLVWTETVFFVASGKKCHVPVNVATALPLVLGIKARPLSLSLSSSSPFHSPSMSSAVSSSQQKLLLSSLANQHPLWPPPLVYPSSPFWRLARLSNDPPPPPKTPRLLLSNPWPPVCCGRWAQGPLQLWYRIR